MKLIFCIFLVLVLTDSGHSRNFGNGLYTGPNFPKKLTAKHWIRTLDMTGHVEGGYFKEIYKSDETIDDLPQRYQNESRSFGSAIYFLLKGSDFSAFHVLKTDELWHFYYGKPLTMYVIDGETGELEVVNLGPREDNHFVYHVKRGSIFGARLKNPTKPSDYTLVGTTVCPGFEYNDFELSNRSQLIEKLPQHQKLIIELTRV